MIPLRPRDPALATEVLYDVFSGALLRWVSQQDPQRGRFVAEADAAVLIVLAGRGYQPPPQDWQALAT